METEKPGIPSFFDSLREGMAQNANVRTIYGEPIVAGNRTVIPVARIGWGFGGGIGRNPRHAQEEHGHEAAGGGGGMGAVPVGIVEVSPERTRFISIGGGRRLAAALTLGVLLGMWLARRRHK
jgi:uncharacterized spore protein YtfJ